MMILREKLKHFATTGTMEEKSSRVKQRKKMLDGLAKWLKVGHVTDTLKVTLR